MKATAMPEAKTAPFCVIANAKAGRGEAGASLDSLLAVHPGLFKLRRVRRGRELEAVASRAIDDGFGVMVAAGGDGTINALANAVSGTKAALGVIPLGTFNYFARRLVLPEQPEQAIAALLAGEPRPIDIGLINDRVFINNASLGLYPAVLQQRERSYRRWGRSRFMAMWSVLRTLWRFRTGFRMKITVDGKEVRLKTPSAFIACNPYQLRSVKLEGAEMVEDGKLALITAPDCGRFQLMLNFIRLGLGLAQRGREFELFSGEEITIEIRRRHQLIAIDGERLRLAAPFRLCMKPGGLNVIVPREGV